MKTQIYALSAYVLVRPIYSRCPEQVRLGLWIPLGEIFIEVLDLLKVEDREG